MKKTEFVIGIDGGGTKTAAQLSDLRGKVVAESQAGPSNFQVIGVDAAATTIVELIVSCCSKAQCEPSQVAAICVGLTGAGRPGDQRRMAEGVRRSAVARRIVFGNLFVESDARIALEGAFKGSAGIILISGTGSIAFGKDRNGNVHRVGGWGRILGDEGSGYTIGRHGLNAVTKHLDGRGGKTLLTDLVAQRLGLSTQEQIVAAVYGENFDVASVAPLVIEAATSRDLICERILNKATFELAEHVRALTLKIEAASGGHARQKIPLSFIGSVLSGENVLTKIATHKITYSLPQISIVKPQAQPVYGAVLLAIQSMATV